MGIMTFKDLSLFWELPSSGLQDFYSEAKKTYYRRINEQNIAVAKMNVNILAIASSFGGDKNFNSEQAFNQSLPFDPEILEGDENQLSSELIDIIDYYMTNSLIPTEIQKTMYKDKDFRNTIIAIKAKNAKNK